MTKETILEHCVNASNERIYRLEKMRSDDEFWLSLSGSKKGSKYMGGGIPIPNLEFANEICRVIKQIASLDKAPSKDEMKVCFFNHRRKTVTGETRNFKGKWFYRVKCYQNFFRKNGEIFFYKDHELKASGRGYFIQEFDFPLNESAKDEASEFAGKLQSAIEQELIGKIDAEDDNVLELLHKEQLLIGGEPAWVNSDTELGSFTLHKPLFDIVCDKLRQQPLTPDALAINLGLSQDEGNRQLHPNSRYDPRFSDKEFLLDRVRKGFTSLHYLITQIPQEALEQSPVLTNLFEENSSGNWDDWKRVTFSNDEYSTGKLQSYHIAQVELDAYEGGMEVGIEPQISQMRATAIRLFDLKRHHERDAEKSKKVQELITRFTAVAEEADYV